MKTQLGLVLLTFLVSVCAHHHEGGKMGFSDVNNEVTVKLLQTFTEDDNAVFSPILLSNSLLLLTNSVSGTAKDELMKLLSLSDKG